MWFNRSFRSCIYSKTLPMDILKALVIVVIAYTSATMIMAANKNKRLLS